MEKIKVISIIEKKTSKGGSFWAVNYDNLTTGVQNCNATIGEWHKSVAELILKKVGFGGICLAEVVSKGQYKNIEAVVEALQTDLGQVTEQKENKTGNKPAELKETNSFLSVKDINIMAQTFTKCVAYHKPMDVDEVMNTFNQFVKKLENNE